MDTSVPESQAIRAAAAAGEPGSVLSVELNPEHVEVEPGGQPIEVIVSVHNLSNIVEQYTIQIVGLDGDWFTAPVASLSLFPQDRDQVRLTLHPPKRQGVRTGSYPFQVVVRGRSGVGEYSAA